MLMNEFSPGKFTFLSILGTSHNRLKWFRGVRTQATDALKALFANSVLCVHTSDAQWFPRARVAFGM